MSDKGTGRGKGVWTAKGVQAQQSQDIAELKQIIAEMQARLEELEPDDGGEQPAPETPTEG